MLNVKRNGEIVATVATLTECETVVADSGEVMEGAWEQIVPLGLRTLGRSVWDYGGWEIERVAPKYNVGRPGGMRECELCGKVSEYLYQCEGCSGVEVSQ